jgi:hypothetical protein
MFSRISWKYRQKTPFSACPSTWLTDKMQNEDFVIGFVFVHEEKTCCLAISPFIHWIGTIFGNVKTRRVWRMNDECIGKNDKLISLCLQLHYVRHFVPTETGESKVKFGYISSHDEIRLKIWFPIYLYILHVRTLLIFCCGSNCAQKGV